MLLLILFFHLTVCPALLSSVEIISSPPLYTIEGAASKLNHPEGIAFSPSGDFIAVANARSNNILFYRIFENDISKMTPEPAFIMKGHPAFSYPHDLSFSPGGEHLAIVSSYSNKITIHERDEVSGFYKSEAMAVIHGKKAGLRNAHTVKYNPAGNRLAVCDVAGNSVALFKRSNNHYDEIPCQILSLPLSLMDRPDGVAFSSDGSLLAATSHATHSVILFANDPTAADEYDPIPIQILHGEETGFHFTHSLAFHPFDHTLVVSSAAGKKTVAIFRRQPGEALSYPLIPSQILEIYNPLTYHMHVYEPEEGGVKGVAFSPSGKVLAILSTDHGNSRKSVILFAVE
ncbi:WD40 repeat domain-containing protein [Estrella lausannensis]|uniref:Putative 6-phosphogluconolactonase n=1 Tax=Estrella lausannensis TaxID=483423 RepID=A0A0H5DRW8_9BACT|nr:beta-propeller fold lactonase family protein [Estrella lausannensis]CRX39466.1 Putative 6-phosphogluconolactonase [Estrella lausannensis]